MSIEKMNFKRWVHKVLPAVYDESLSYYELLCKVIAKLNETIDLSNGTAEGLEQLKNYVDTYFDNLDIQEEVNAKLDEMAQSGELAELISQYLEAQAVIGFNNNSSLASATNLANGSFAKTYGKNTYNDGKGAFYKIRTRTNADVPDGDTLIALTNTENLVAEIIPFSRTYNMQQEINQLKSRKYIFIGDSYGTGQNELQEQTVPWTTLVPQYLGLSSDDYIKNSSNGSGFRNGTTFKVQLQSIAEDTSVDNDSITDIVVVGGYNDRYYTREQIFEKMEEFFTYAKQQFPNAKCKLAHVGWSKVYDVRQSLANATIYCYTHCGKYGCQYLKNTEYILHDYSLFSGDNYHPNQNGQNELSSYLTDAILNGSCNVIRGFVTPTIEMGPYITSQLDSGTYILQSQNNGEITLMASLGFLASNPVTLAGNSSVTLCSFTDGLIMGGGLPIFRTYQQVFCADNNGAFKKFMCAYNVMFNTADIKCDFNLTTQNDNVTQSNLTAFNNNIVYLQIPALYC